MNDSRHPDRPSMDPTNKPLLSGGMTGDSKDARPSCWWLTGLPAAGKTTLANALAAHLVAGGQPACVLDGDELRAGLNKDLGFSVEARKENMRRVAEIARILNGNGIHAVVALVSPTLHGRATAREIVGPDRFFEVHVSTPLSVCQQRDPKGLYLRARTDAALGLTGFQSSYEAPSDPHLIIDTSKTNVARSVALLVELADRTRSD